jgi:hypothetical protein
VRSGADGSLLKLYSGGATNDSVGTSLAGGADISGDGFPDIVIGAIQGNTALPGYHQVFSGVYRLGNKYGTAVPNSLGVPASIDATGSISRSANQLTLLATGLPPNVSGLFFYGPTMMGPLPAPIADGNRWVDGPLRRLPVINTGPAGPGGTASVSFTVNLAVGTPLYDLLQPGTEWNFQLYYRNVAGGPAHANVSDALNVGILP